VDRVIDRRGRDRSVELDEGSREPGIEDRRRQRCVEQARLTCAYPDAAVGRAAGECLVAEGRPHAVVLKHRRHARDLLRVGRVQLAWTLEIRHTQLLEAARVEIVGEDRQRRSLQLAVLLHSRREEGRRAAFALDPDRDLDRAGDRGAGELEGERARRPLVSRGGLDRAQDDRRHVAAVRSPLDPPALAHRRGEATPAEALHRRIQIEAMHRDRCILADRGAAGRSAVRPDRRSAAAAPTR
jgi:hypothetical protein